jgi:hypothetical protein
MDDIPPSCPVYDTRYVYIYDVTPSVIYMGYLPGYIGCHPYYGTVVYGTGYRYRAWRGHHYYPRPCTWGYHARYNPWLSRWSFGSSYGSGFLRVGSRWRATQPSTHRHAQLLWFGPGGYRRPLVDRDMTLLRIGRPGRLLPHPADRMPANLYNRSENIVRVDRTASRMPVRPVASPAAHAPGIRNNVFAGKDGRVYQRGENGSWKVNQGRAWRPTPPPNTPAAMPSLPRGVTVGGLTTGSAGTGARPRPRPMPVQPPSEGGAQPANLPRMRPAPPTISPVPGNLEREFRARQRSNERIPSGAATPSTHSTPATHAPARGQRPKDKAQSERKP